MWAKVGKVYRKQPREKKEGEGKRNTGVVGSIARCPYPVWCLEKPVDGSNLIDQRYVDIEGKQRRAGGLRKFGACTERVNVVQVLHFAC